MSRSVDCKHQVVVGSSSKSSLGVSGVMAELQAPISYPWGQTDSVHRPCTFPLELQKIERTHSHLLQRGINGSYQAENLMKWLYWGPIMRAVWLLGLWLVHHFGPNWNMSGLQISCHLWSLQNVSYWHCWSSCLSLNTIMSLKFVFFLKYLWNLVQTFMSPSRWSSKLISISSYQNLRVLWSLKPKKPKFPSALSYTHVCCHLATCQSRLPDRVLSLKI